MNQINLLALILSGSFLYSCSKEKTSAPMSIDGVKVEDLKANDGFETKTVDTYIPLYHNVDELLEKFHSDSLVFASNSCFAINAKVTFTAKWTINVQEHLGPEVKTISEYKIDKVVYKSSNLHFISDCSNLNKDPALPSEFIELPRSTASHSTNDGGKSPPKNIRSGFTIKFPTEINKAATGEEENIVVEYVYFAGEWNQKDLPFSLTMFGDPKLFSGNRELGSISGIDDFNIDFRYICGLSVDENFKAEALLTDDKCDIKTEELSGGPDGPEYINIIDIEPITK